MSMLATAFVSIKVGTTAFTRGLRVARTIFRGSMGAMKTLVRGFSKVAVAGFTRVTRAAMGLGRGLLSFVLRPIKMLLGPVGRLVALFGAGFITRAALRTFSEFESNMAFTQAVTQATASEFEDLQKIAIDLGETTRFTAAQAADAMTQFGLAGFTVKEIMGAIEPTLNLAAAGMVDIRDAAAITSNIMRSMKLPVSELGNVTDVLTRAMTNSNNTIQDLGTAFQFVGPVAQAAGKSVEEVTAALEALGNAGLRGEKGGTIVRNVLARLSGGTSETNKVLNKLGVSVVDVNGALKPLSVIIDDVNRAMAGMGEAERTAELMKAFGLRAGPGMAALLGVGGRELRKFEFLLRTSGVTAEGVAKRQMNTFRGSMLELVSVIQTAGIRFGQALAPGIRMASEGLKVLVSNMGRLMAVVEPLTTAIGVRMKNAFGSMGKAINDLIPRARLLFARLGAAVREPRKALQVITAAMKVLKLQLFIGFREMLPKVIPFFKKMGVAIGEALVEFLKKRLAPMVKGVLFAGTQQQDILIPTGRKTAFGTDEFVRQRETRNAATKELLKTEFVGTKGALAFARKSGLIRGEDQGLLAEEKRGLKKALDELDDIVAQHNFREDPLSALFSIHAPTMKRVRDTLMKQGKKLRDEVVRFNLREIQEDPRRIFGKAGAQLGRVAGIAGVGLPGPIGALGRVLGGLAGAGQIAGQLGFAKQKKPGGARALDETGLVEFRNQLQKALLGGKESDSKKQTKSLEVLEKAAMNQLPEPPKVEITNPFKDIQFQPGGPNPDAGGDPFLE